MIGRIRITLRPPRLALAAFLVAVLPPLAACGGGDEQLSTSEKEAAGEADDGPGIRGDTVEVHLDDFSIEMPETLPPGELVFVVRNVGVEDHNFEIMRDGELLWEFDRELRPGRSQEMTLSLEPGEYAVLCTVSSHDGRGMVGRVTVSDNSDSDEP